MEPRKFGFAIGFLLIVFSSTLFLFKSNQISLFGEWIWKYAIQASFPESSSKQTHRHSFAVIPNLTSCHKSYGREGLLVYCCPPRTELSETVVDFEFPDESSPTRIRRPAHLVDDEYLAKYRKALNIMKSLPEDDPRNFMRQANLHCLFCTSAYNQKNFDPFPVQIHKSWLFFPWHRMLVYFHERILGSLIGDETFALPYWAWDVPEGMQYPSWYLNDPFMDSERDISHFPPSVVDLDYNDSKSGLSPEDQVRNNLALMYRQMVSGAKKMELFMGCPFKAGEDGYCEGRGTIEVAPHNTVHRWVGSNLHVPGREDMGVFYSAARDPIFYAHHNNIDRLFDVWRDHHQDIKIDDPDLLDSYFFFHDENNRFVRIRVCDVLDTSKLKYSYEKVETPWINSRPKPSVPVKIARQVLLKTKNFSNLLKMVPSREIVLSSEMTIRVMRPRIGRSEEEKGREEEVLVVQGVDVKKDEFVKFDVYVNFVGGKFNGPSCSEYAGTFVHVPSGVSHGNDENFNRKKSELKLGISELLRDLEAEEDESILVTLVPRSRSCINVTVDGLMIEFLR